MWREEDEEEEEEEGLDCGLRPLALHINNRGSEVDETHYFDLKSSVITFGILTSV